MSQAKKYFCHVCGREIEEKKASIASLNVITRDPLEHNRMLAPVCHNCMKPDFANTRPAERKTWIVNAFYPLMTFGSTFKIEGEWK